MLLISIARSVPTLFERVIKMSEHYDLEEAHYWWSINEVCELIRQYGYTKVLTDIDKALKSEDLETEMYKIVTEG